MKDRLEILSIGVSHHTAPIAVRERVAVASERLEEALHELCARPGIAEAMIVSTCNRLEIYAAVRGEEGPASARAFLREREPGIDRHLYENRGLSAVRHLFRVCASLDSMVVGEPQILGQVKEAFRRAEQARTVGRILSRSVQRAFAVAKRVRTDTQIGAAAVSVGFAGVELARKVLGSLQGRSAMLVGAGEIGTLAARHLAGAGCADLHVVNRSRERAEALAAELGATAHPWDALFDLLVRCDVVVCSTSAQDPILTRDRVQEAMRKRRHRPLLIVDLAVPRDVDPRANEVPDVYLYDVDDLDRVMEENRESRKREAALAEGIVEREAQAFYAALHNEAEPLLRAIRRQAEEIVRQEIARTLGREEFDEKQRAGLEAMARAIANKILHLPTTRIREAGLEDDGALLAAAATLFGLGPAAAEASRSAPAAGVSAERPAAVREGAATARPEGIAARVDRARPDRQEEEGAAALRPRLVYSGSGNS